MFFLPKLYSTHGTGCEHFRFVKVRHFANDSMCSMWQQVKKLGLGFYISKGQPIYDWNQMFYEFSSNPPERISSASK